jgi:type II secretory ATPase GspE/PulE/Tfp pilus assembly ATPase PilB-like protein
VDPVEYEIAGISQVEVDQQRTKSTSSKALPHLLRHGPRRRHGSARSATPNPSTPAVKAASTGHLVLSTLHTTTP